MSPRTPWALGGLCVALAATLVALRAGGPATQGPARSVLLPFAASQVIRVRLRFAGGPALQLERRAKGWWGRIGDERWRANRAEIDAALAELEILTVAGQVRDAKPGSVHGLAPPRLVVHMSTGARSAEIAFGSRAASRRCYAAMNGALYVVGARARDLWGRSAHDLRDRRLLHFDGETAREVTIGSLEVRRGNARWFLSKPQGARADPDQVRELLAVLATIRETDGSAKAPAAPEIVVVDDEGRHRARTGLSKTALERLRALADSLAARYPAALPGATIDRVEVRAGSDVLRLSRRDDRWILPSGERAEGARVRGLLGTIHRLSPREILGPEARALAEPVERVISWQAGMRRDELQVGPDKAGRRAVRFAGEKAIYLFADGNWARASTHPLAWRRRVLWDLPPAAIERIRVDGHEVRRDERYRWVRVSPPGTGANHRAISEAVGRLLARPRVLHFLLKRPAPWRPIHTLVVETIDGRKRTEHVARVGRHRGKDAWVAEVEGRFAVIAAAQWTRIAKVVRGDQ